MAGITLKEGLNERNISLTPIAPVMATLQGIVSDSSTGARIAEALVQLLDAAGAVIASDYSDSQGVYIIANVNPGTYRLVCRKEGYQTKEI